MPDTDGATLVPGVVNNGMMSSFSINDNIRWR